MKTIKNVIFDLGGVLLNINVSLFSEKLIELSGIGIMPILKQMEAEKFFDRYESGHFSDQHFLSECVNRLGQSINPQQIKEAWNSILLDLPRERLNLLSKLRQRKRIFLLSNTNQIHLDHINQKILREYSISNLSELFEEVYLSFAMKLKKPDPEIFKVVLQASQLKPSETIFIDDSRSNVEAAEQTGIVGVHLKPGIEVGQILKDLNIVD